jgi:4-hydroxy-2-oxoheptanedioate aldolase
VTHHISTGADIMSGTNSSKLNHAKARLSEGKPTFGLIVTIPGVQVVQVLAHAGFDWLIIDMEHGPIDINAAHAMIVATAGTQTTPFVRIPWNSGWQAKTVMDLGALGICFPMVCGAEDALSVVSAVRYPPMGQRLWGPFYAPLRWGQSLPQYIASANNEVMSIATIEHPNAIEHIDEIAATSDLDLAFIGPGDLAMSMGIPGQFDHPSFKEAVARAERGLLNSKVALGGVARTTDQARDMIDRGYRAIVLGGFDWMLLQQAAGTLLTSVRQ